VTRHLVIVGATATGKSALALELARQLGDVEVVSLDAMQVYREMDIGTAKPSSEERAAVPHHLIDVADPAEEWSVRRTQDAVRDAIGDIERRGRRAILVGGTGLYVRAVVDDLAVPPADAALRAELESDTNCAASLAAAYERLRELDPTAAARIEPANRRRIVRALEVIAATGRPFSSFGPGLDQYGTPAMDARLIGLSVPADEARRRIAERFAAMTRRGLVDEVRALAARSKGLGRTARQAIGYKEVLMHLDGEIASLDDALDLAIRRTRKFARRQRVWFRRDPRVEWFADPEKLDSLADAVLATWCIPTPTSSP